MFSSFRHSCSKPSPKWRTSAHPPRHGPRRKSRGLHGGWLCPRQRQARRLHGADDRRLQPCRGPARRLHGRLADDRHHRRPDAAVAVSPRLPGSRRHLPVRRRSRNSTPRSITSPACPISSGRPSASPPRARPGRCICSCAAPSRPDHRGGSRARSARGEDVFTRVPPFRPEPECRRASRRARARWPRPRAR